MCGLFFSAGLPFDRHRIDIVHHRGPDAEGCVEMDWSGRPICLAHKRLAIIDLSDNAKQPAQSSDGRYSLVFNGEIYNFVALAEQLRAAGHFDGPVNDTRVLLAGLVAYGAAFLPQLSGMFAFVFVDNETRSVIAARDRFGIKPLYYVARPDTLGFGSEIKQLLDWDGVARQGNASAVFDFLKFGVADHSAETFFDGIFQMRPGHFVQLDLSGDIPEVAQKCWYDLSGAVAVRAGEITDDNDWHASFRRAVHAHLVSDVLVGSCLSGGLDSSAIVASVSDQQQDDASFKTFTAIYPGEAIDESEFADEMVRAFKLDGHTTQPNATKLLADIENLIWFQEEPFGSTSIFAQWCVFSSAREAGVKVMLDGQGADEILHGYFSIFPIYIRDLLKRGRFAEAAVAIWRGRSALWVNPLKYSLKALAFIVPGRVRRFLDRLVAENIDGDWLKEGFVGANANSPMSVLARAQMGSESGLDENALRLVEQVNLPMMLHWEDRNSMARSIEARVPFLDHELVEQTLAMPLEARLHYGVTKRVLRRAMANILPAKILQRRRKIGFAAPEDVWMRQDLRDWARRRVGDTLNRFPHIFNQSETLAVVDKTLAGKRSFDPLVWRIICLGLWAEIFDIGSLRHASGWPDAK